MTYSVAELIKSDLHRYCGRYSHWLLCKNLLNANRAFKYSLWLRLCRSENCLLRFVALRIHNHLSTKYQIQIPPQTQIGPGLYLGHGTSIIINKTAILGKNCNLSHFVTIGANDGPAAVIGNNVYIGPNVCIIEHLYIGDDVTIGAGAIVVKDIPPRVTVAGNPARIISEKNPARFITNRYEASSPQPATVRE